MNSGLSVDTDQKYALVRKYNYIYRKDELTDICSGEKWNIKIGRYRLKFCKQGS